MESVMFIWSTHAEATTVVAKFYHHRLYIYKIKLNYRKLDRGINV